jgi:hypothetical protein
LAFAKESRCDLADMPFSGLRFASCSMVASTTVAVAGTRRIKAQGTDLDLARETVAAAGKSPELGWPATNRGHPVSEGKPRR